MSCQAVPQLSGCRQLCPNSSSERCRTCPGRRLPGAGTQVRLRRTRRGMGAEAAGPGPCVVGARESGGAGPQPPRGRRARVPEHLGCGPGAGVRPVPPETNRNQPPRKGRAEPGPCLPSGHVAGPPRPVGRGPLGAPGRAPPPVRWERSGPLLPTRGRRGGAPGPAGPARQGPVTGDRAASGRGAAQKRQ